MEKKLDNLLSFSDFEKSWKTKESKKTKRTETGLDVFEKQNSNEFEDENDFEENINQEDSKSIDDMEGKSFRRPLIKLNNKVRTY